MVDILLRQADRRSHKKLQATKEEQNQLKHQLAQGATRTMEMASIRMGMFVVVV